MNGNASNILMTLLTVFAMAGGTATAHAQEKATATKAPAPAVEAPAAKTSAKTDRPFAERPASETSDETAKPFKPFTVTLQTGTATAIEHIQLAPLQDDITRLGETVEAIGGQLRAIREEVRIAIPVRAIGTPAYFDAWREIRALSRAMAQRSNTEVVLLLQTGPKALKNPLAMGHMTGTNPGEVDQWPVQNFIQTPNTGFESFPVRVAVQRNHAEAPYDRFEIVFLAYRPDPAPYLNN